jgi:uncharacterized repeat protein (TIGR03803 family)
MTSLPFRRAALALAAAAFLAGCGGSQPPISAPGVVRSTSLRGTAAQQTRPHVLEGVLYSFGRAEDGGYNPYSDLINVKGILYGTAAGNGNGNGIVYSITTSGNKTIVYSFEGYPTDGAGPSNLINVNGTLYGSTVGGGTRRYGTVFAITTSGRETVLHNFAGGLEDGSEPSRSLINVNGMLYGTTFLGGENGKHGTVFAITTSGKESVLYSFAGGPDDGANPSAGLVDINGTLYGTTQNGGLNCTDSGYGYGCGTVFKLMPSGGHYTERVLHRFNGDRGGDGQNPQADLINVNGTLYGTTESGGVKGEGTVFAITTSGKETVLHKFAGGPGDGSAPSAGLVNVNGTLFGTTWQGGANRIGTVYSVRTSGTEAVVYSFKGSPSDGAYPAASLINLNGALYSTTTYGGEKHNAGTVFELTP